MAATMASPAVRKPLGAFWRRMKAERGREAPVLETPEARSVPVPSPLLVPPAAP